MVQKQIDVLNVSYGKIEWYREVEVEVQRIWWSPAPRELAFEKEQGVLQHVALLKRTTILVPCVVLVQDGLSCEICGTSVLEGVVWSHHPMKNDSNKPDTVVGIEGKAKNQRSQIGSSVDVDDA